MKIKFFFSIVLLGSFTLLIFVDSISASCNIPIRFSGPNTTDIIPGMNMLRTQIGGINNGIGGTFPTGYREVDWDIPDGPNGPNASRIIPRDFYNDLLFGFPKGLILDGSFDITTAYGSSSMGPVRFGDMDATYPNEFKVFSGPRLLGLATIPPSSAKIEPSFIEFSFVIPGTNTPATVSGFGIVFTDVDLFENASVTLFGPNGLPLAVPNSTSPIITSIPADKGFSFVGITCSPERIARVRIRSGRHALAPNNVDDAFRDMVAMDDIIYGEPKAVCPTNCYFKPADFAGDGFSDYVVVRNGTWFIFNNPQFTVTVQNFGQPCDIPINGDFDGDNRADFAVYRKPGQWWILPSSGSPPSMFRNWGLAGDIPVTGDYNGDGKTDIAIWRPGAQSYYHVLFSPDFLSNTLSLAWGTSVTSFPNYSDFPFVAAADPCPPY